MSQIISLSIFFIFVIVYYYVVRRKYARFDYSPINYMIDKLYNNWYSKNASLINRKKTTVYDIDKALFQLKTEVEKKGIDNKLINEYISSLEKLNSRPKLGIKDVIIGFLGLISTNSWIESQFNTIGINDVMRFFQDSDTLKNLIVIIHFLLIVLIVVLFVFFLYVMLRIETVHKDTQKIFLLKRLEEIWCYETNQEEKTLNEILREGETYKNTVFLKFKSEKTNFDRRFDESIGEKIFDNASIVNDILSNSKNRIISFISGFINFILGFILPLLLIIVILSFDFLFSNFLSNKSNWIVVPIINIVLFIFSLVLLILWLIIYDSHIGTFVTKRNEIKKINQVSILYNKRRLKRSWIQGVLYISLIIIFWLISMGFNSDIKIGIIIQCLLISICSLINFFITIKK